MPAGFRPLRLRHAVAMTAAAARTFRAGRGVARSGRVTVRCRTAGAVLLVCRRRGARTPRTAVV